MTEKFATPSAIEAPEPHKWDRDGEKCVKCGASDWMAGPCKPRPCTCHPDDNPPVPCPRKYALYECRAAHYERFGTMLPLGERPKESDAEILARSSTTAPEAVRITEVVGQDGSPVAAPCAISGCQYAKRSTVSWPDESGPVPTRPKIAPQAPVLAALILAQSALRQWTESYGLWSEQMPAGMSNKLPPGNHVRALEAIAEALELEKSSAITPPHNAQNCSRCLGSGSIRVLAGGGPEAHEVDAECPQCGGTGVIS